MSLWTYAGIKFIADGKLSVNDIENMVGHIRSFEDIKNTDGSFTEYHNENEYFLLPHGSEGTFDIYIEKTTNNRTVFRVGGGIRDVWSTKETEEWFNKIIERNESGNIYPSLILRAKGYCSADGGGKSVSFDYKYRFSKEEIFSRIKYSLWSVLYDIKSWVKSLACHKKGRNI